MSWRAGAATRPSRSRLAAPSRTIFVAALPGLLLAAIILGGVRSGVFTATESSTIAVIYAMLVTAVVYRSLSWEDFKIATLGAVRTTAVVLLVIGTASAFGFLLALAADPRGDDRADDVASPTTRFVIFLLINLILLVLGCFMDMAPLILITHADLPAGRHGQVRHGPGAVRHGDA